MPLEIFWFLQISIWNKHSELGVNHLSHSPNTRPERDDFFGFPNFCTNLLYIQIYYKYDPSVILGTKTWCNERNVVIWNKNANIDYIKRNLLSLVFFLKYLPDLRVYQNLEEYDIIYGISHLAALYFVKTSNKNWKSQTRFLSWN